MRRSRRRGHLQQLRTVLEAFDDALQRGDATTANAVGADFSTILISACGNRELQNHVDLVVARTQPVLARGAESELWRVWLDGERVEDLLAEPSRADARADGED